MTVEELKGHPVADLLGQNVVDTKVSEIVFVAFDTETTGLNPIVSGLVELSGVKFLGNGDQISTFSSLINPEGPIPPEVTAIHGITDAMVQDAPTFREVVPEFIEWAVATDEVELLQPTAPVRQKQPTIMMAHNASFDISFLEVAMCKLSMQIPDNKILDTLTLSRRIIDGPDNYQLKTLTDYLGINASTYHRALADSQHVRHLFLAMTTMLEETQRREVVLADLMEVGGLMQFTDPLKPGFDQAFIESPEYVCIKNAIDEGHDVRLQYSGARKSVRIVTPRSVLFARGNYYLSAYCRYAQAERTFRIDRIIKLEKVERRV